MAKHDDDDVVVPRQNSVRGQMFDLSALIRRRSRLDDHPPAPVLRQNSVRRQRD